MSSQTYQSRELRSHAVALKRLSVEIVKLARDHARPGRDGSWPSTMNLVERLVKIRRVVAEMEGLLLPKDPVGDGSGWEED